MMLAQRQTPASTQVPVPSPAPLPAAIRLERVTKTYGGHGNLVTALASIDLLFHQNTFTAVMGPSGSGKSTLLHCAAGLDQPTSGQVWLGDTNLSQLSATALTKLRRRRIGFVFQAYNLVGALTVLENITLPFRLAGTRPERVWLEQVVERVGLGDRLRHRPAELSGGQQQRVAIARALAVRPEVVFCDEPTGALDTESARQVLDMLRDMVSPTTGTGTSTGTGQTVVMVTHDPAAASYADRVVMLTDGRVVDDLPQPGVDRIAEQLARLGSRASKTAVGG